jgi:hypothetical protein
VLTEPRKDEPVTAKQALLDAALGAAILACALLGLGHHAEASVRARYRAAAEANLVRMLYQGQVLGLEANRYFFYSGMAPGSFEELDSAGLSFLRPYNFFANRTAKLSTSEAGLEDGDIVLKSFGTSGIYVGIIVNGKSLPAYQTADPPLDKTVATMTDKWVADGQWINVFLSDPANFRTWAAVQTVRDIVNLYNSRIGSLQTWDELAPWGLMPFDGIGRNPIDGGPIGTHGGPGNLIVRRRFDLPPHWAVLGIGRGGRPIPAPFAEYFPGFA